MAKRQIRDYVFTPGASGVGNIKVLDKLQLNQILLITNVTDNRILYNFSDPTNKVIVEFSDSYDAAFPYANTASNGVTTIHFQFDTSDQSSTDSIQIFIEDEEVRFRPYNFGTDAIERMRVATPQSMLDADFEYGLQPTKWQTVDFMRGYPSIYEVPGSDLQVTTITTDASSASSGVGDSLITVTTSENHGLSVGSPIRVINLSRSLFSSVRAEGTFVVLDILSNTSFRYYAKGRVGTTNGESLYTTSIQLRKGGFYTGSDIGTPTFSVTSQGSSGSFTSLFDTPNESTRIAYTGINTAQIGSPLTGTGVTTGTQVTGIVTTTSTVTVANNVFSPSNTISLNSISGISVGSAVSTGVGVGTALFVTNIVGNTVTLSGNLLRNYTGTADNIGIRTGEPRFGRGNGVLFDVTRQNGSYSVSLSVVTKSGTTGIAGSTIIGVANTTSLVVGQSVIGVGIGTSAVVSGIGTTTVTLNVPNSGTVSGVSTFTNNGIQYAVDDRIVIDGSLFEGNSPENNLIVRVVGINTITGGITSITSSKEITYGGTPKISTAQFKDGGSSILFNPTDGTVDYVSVASTSDFSFGSSDFTVDFWIYRNRTGTSEHLFDMRASSTTEVAVSLLIDSSDKVNFLLNGSNVITGITTATISTWHHVALSRSGSTTRLFVNGNLEGFVSDSNNYANKPVVVGSRYNGTFGFYGYVDELRVSKGVSRFTSSFDPAASVTYNNDVYNVLYMKCRGSNNTTSFADDSQGVAPLSDKTYLSVFGVASGSGTGARFNVLRVGGASPSYTATLVDGGENYASSETITIDGSALGGVSSVNDLTITVTTANGSGSITAFTSSGTADSGYITVQAIGDYNGRASNSGTGATFTLTKSGTSYFATVVNPGTGYYPGYQIYFAGVDFGYVSPDNDLYVTISGSDIINPTFGNVSTVTTSGIAVASDQITFYPSVTISDPTISTIPNTTTFSFGSLARILVSFSSNHGLVPGETTLVSIASTGTNHQLASGPRLIDEVPSFNQLTYTARSQGTIDTSTQLTGVIYPRPECFYIHRPFDGGVQLGTGSPSHGAHAIRQSKKYIRYQSGKGIMYTTGTLFAPAYDLRSITSSGTAVNSLITIITDDVEHGLQVGAEISLNDITTSGYDGHYTVNSIIDENTFTVLATQTLGNTTAVLGVQAQISLYKWKGATVRAGAFDDQNGIFWQYDGINLSVGMRSATYQIAGTVGISTNSNLISGTNTRFLDQLIVGDRIVIRGMTHVVTNIAGQTSMTVTPDYRGIENVVSGKAALVKETIIPQSQWNVDRADGTGPSGYEIKVGKMQMIGFQYTWYGAGFIDWMLRGPKGDYLFVHRLKNNNRNTEAFMRSGNLPVRYEVINEGAKTRLTQSVGVGSTVIYVSDASVLPSSGSLYIDNEIINYTGIATTSNILTGITRQATFTNFYSGSQRSYSAGISSNHTSGTGIVLLSNTATPVISHWGSAFLTDGLFDQDRGYIFNYQAVNFPVSTTKNTAFLLRLAPSVSNAIVGDLGQRELINRAQLLLQGIEFTPTGGTSATSVVIEGILNPQNYPTNPSNINWFPLSGAGAGGQPSFAQIANGSSVTWLGTVSPTAVSNSINQTFRTQYVIFNRAATINVRTGMNISGTGVPGGTTVVGFANYDATNWFIIFSTAITPGNAGTITFTFSSPVAALPGEQVFSFVGDATQKSMLDLSSLKELNNTPIGGRGTFPNGPDVLAINVYTTGGSAFTGTLALRWGEAQA